MLKYVLFDLETELLSGPLDLDRYVPQITIGATLTSDDELDLWYEKDGAGQASGDVLGQASAQALVRYLQDRARDGYAVVTWNGAGFDMRVLARASDMPEACIDLAWEQVDMMFCLHCRRGFSVALANAAKAVDSAKMAGMSGKDAPRLWDEGRYEQVKQYVAQDVRATAAVYEEAIRTRALWWVNARGRRLRADGPLLSVREAYKLSLPDTSWMSRPSWPREKFVGWMLAHSR